MIENHLRNVERLVNRCPDAYVERYDERVPTPERANLNIRLRMSNGYLLQLRETVSADGNFVTFLKYSYHLQDAGNREIFRYDMAPHHRDISSFPHHKHISDTVQASEKPSIAQVLSEALEYVN